MKSKLDGARVLYMQGTETSTGARHDVKGIASLLKGTDTLLVVDAITGLGTTQFDVDGWGIDIIIGGSQKAVMIPPGLAFLAVSERAWQRMETDEESALLLRPAQRAQVGGEGRVGVYAGDCADRGTAGGAGLTFASRAKAIWRRDAMR